jgi:thioredoxin 1
MTTITTDATISADIKASEYVLVDFFARWCGPCAYFAPIIESAETKEKKVTFFKIDVDTAPISCSKYGIIAVPTLIIFKNGVPVGTQIGALENEAALIQWIDSTLAASTKSATNKVTKSGKTSELKKEKAVQTA